MLTLHFPGKHTVHRIIGKAYSHNCIVLTSLYLVDLFVVSHVCMYTIHYSLHRKEFVRPSDWFENANGNNIEYRTPVPSHDKFWGSLFFVLIALLHKKSFIFNYLVISFDFHIEYFGCVLGFMIKKNATVKDVVQNASGFSQCHIYHKFVLRWCHTHWCIAPKHNPPWVSWI